METTKHPELTKLQNEVKDSINSLLRDIDVGSPDGIKVPQIVLLSLGSAYKLYQILNAISDIDNVVGEPDLPCPVESQTAIQKCRSISKQKDITEEELNFIDKNWIL